MFIVPVNQLDCFSLRSGFAFFFPLLPLKRENKTEKILDK